MKQIHYTLVSFIAIAAGVWYWITRKPKVSEKTAEADIDDTADDGDLALTGGGPGMLGNNNPDIFPDDSPDVTTDNSNSSKPKKSKALVVYVGGNKKVVTVKPWMHRANTSGIVRHDGKRFKRSKSKNYAYVLKQLPSKGSNNKSIV